MPALYLLDSIIKNHGDPYRAVFQPNLVSTFVAVFEALEDPQVRMALYKLRNTWNSLFDPRVLEDLDVRVQGEFDRKWPIQRRPGEAAAVVQGRNSIALKMAPKTALKMALKWNFEQEHMSQLKRVKSKEGPKMHPKTHPKRAPKLCY